MFLELLLTMKVKHVDKMMLIYVLFLMSSTKHYHLIIPVLICFLILGNIQDGVKVATIVADVTGLQQHHHSSHPHLVEKMKGFPLKAKSFRNTATYQKFWGGLPFACTSEG